MENKEQPKGNAPMPDSPKPTDEVQLNIETVTPDTEKNVVPTDVTEEKRMNEEVLKSENGKEEQEQNSEQENSKAHEETEDREESVTAEGNSDDDATENGDHPGDEIETVSP